MPPRPHMRDACEVGILSTVSTGAEPVEAYVYASSTRCTFAISSTNETVDGNKRAVVNTKILLPVGVTVESSSRIKLTKRNRSILGTPEYFDVIGEPNYVTGNRSIVVDCQSVPLGAE